MSHIIVAGTDTSTHVTAVKWCLDNSISSQVTSPVSVQDLASALITALESNTQNPVFTPNDISFDILLAEDNMVNQKLAVKILEKYGNMVEIADNGAIAVDAFKRRIAESKPFDIILVRFHSHIFSSLSDNRSRWMCLCRSWAVWRRQNTSDDTRRRKAYQTFLLSR